MSDQLTRSSLAARAEGSTVFAQTMGLVAATTGVFALGAYLGRNLSFGWGLAFWVASLACLVGISFGVRAGEEIGVGLLFLFGLLVGLAMAPTIAYYAHTSPQAVWQAGGATALFVAGFGAAGYATRRDLSVYARVLFWALVGLIVYGIVLIFAQIPGGERVYSILGLVVFAGYVMFDFQRLRLTTDDDSAPLLAASIFVDMLNVFTFFLSLFGGGRTRRA
ncbi:MAG TPA: Bax inhibitor-1 family protein [Gaiellaceae bacterium]|nr:Bax inhibitor-1 family protein [Gaiellaceae bacterium]